MSNTGKAFIGLFALAVVAACAPKQEEVIYFEPAPPVVHEQPYSGKYGK